MIMNRRGQSGSPCLNLLFICIQGTVIPFIKIVVFCRFCECLNPYNPLVVKASNV
jgi:hypothetical protein